MYNGIVAVWKNKYRVWNVYFQKVNPGPTASKVIAMISANVEIKPTKTSAKKSRFKRPFSIFRTAQEMISRPNVATAA